MNLTREVISRDTDAWRAQTEAHFVREPGPLDDRLDDLQALLACDGYRVDFGFELEFILQRKKSVPELPDKEDFYVDLVRDLCHDDKLPPAVQKGRLVDPAAYPAPIILSAPRANTYNPDQWDTPIIEIKTAPGGWRTGRERYWNTLEAIGRLAADRGCRAKLLATHSNSSITHRTDDGERERVPNTTAAKAELLVATQYGRRYLQAFETYAGYAPGHDTYPSKAARWAVYAERIEHRIPAVSIIDPRADMLGAMAGLYAGLNGEIPAEEYARAHDCYRVNAFALYGLDGLMVWDDSDGKMMLPERMNRSNVRAAQGESKLAALDSMVRSASGGQTTDFSDRNARVLRRMIRGLDLPDRESISLWADGLYHKYWRDFLVSYSARTQPGVRLAGACSPYAAHMNQDIVQNQIAMREAARSSTIAVRLLGPAVIRALTPAAEAAHTNYECRQARPVAAAVQA